MFLESPESPGSASPGVFQFEMLAPGYRSFGDGEVHEGIDASKWREILRMMVSKRNTL